MTKILEIADQAGYEAWIAARPQMIQDMIRRWPPTELYRLKTTGQRVTVSSYGEDGTICVAVSGQFNLVMHERIVHGIDPGDLEPCDLPGLDEPVGVLHVMPAFYSPELH